MKESGILYTPANVLAILGGRKSQTRRIVTAHNSTVNGGPAAGVWSNLKLEHGLAGKHTLVALEDHHISVPYCHPGDPADYNPEEVPRYRVRPKLEPGDRLWLREEHYRFGHWEPAPGVKTKVGRMKWHFIADSPEVLFTPPPRGHRKGRHHNDSATAAWHKRLGRFMPRALSRLTLEIVSVRMERLQEISEGDAIAEGIEPFVINGVREGWRNYGSPDPFEAFRSPVDSYHSLFDSIHGPGSWDRNDWVWVYEFKPLSA